MNPREEIEDPRRRQLVRMLALGLFYSGIGSSSAQGLFGSRPAPLPPGRSIYRIDGSATVNGNAASLETAIRPGDTVATGPGSEIVFVVGSHSAILRADSQLVVGAARPDSGSSILLAALRLVTGAILTVSRNTNLRVNTPTATVGIRGTGFYAEVEPDQTYFCTCYGTADVAAAHDPNARETVVATQHDRPLYILGPGAGSDAIRNAPFINHTDRELMLIETLVGRTTPFVVPGEQYDAPRREYR